MPRTNYGIPYKGSKNMIAEWVVSHVPECNTFIDAFAGGCAISDCILREGRAKHIIANDIDPLPVKCFGMALRGEFADECRWVSREDFLALKDTDPYVRFCYSFGNNARDYAYSTTIEPYKRAMHYALVYGDWDDFKRLCPEVVDACRSDIDGIIDHKERRLAFQQSFTNRIKELSGDNWPSQIVQNNPQYSAIKTKTPKRHLTSSNDAPRGERATIREFECSSNLERLERLQSLEGLERLQSLERLERLQSLESLEPALETSNTDFRELTERILSYDGAFVYCDPPYRGTNGYGVEFDHDTFLDWALEIGMKRPILISEYAIDHEGFIEVDAKQKQSNINANTTFSVTEKLYTVKGGVYAKEEIRN